MRLFFREQELAALRRDRESSETDSSRMTALAGRFGTGKTRLALEAGAGRTVVYWRCASAPEAALAAEFAEAASEALGIFIPPSVRTVTEVFECALRAGMIHPLTLILDNLPDLTEVRPELPRELCGVWDRLRPVTRVHLVVTGSPKSAMRRLFTAPDAVFAGRASNFLIVHAFQTTELRELLHEVAPESDNAALLALDALTGGSPRYVMPLLKNGCFDRPAMLAYATRADSPFLSEGVQVLGPKFGRHCGSYFAVLSLIARGVRTQSEISARLGGMAVGGHLRRLEEEHELIRKIRPVFAEPRSQTVSYDLRDPFFKFWFRFIYRHAALVESGRAAAIAPRIEAELPEFLRSALIARFRAELRRGGGWREVGCWRPARGRGAGDEIDVLAVSADGRELFAADVVLQRRDFRRERFLEKLALLRAELPGGAEMKIETGCLALEDL